MIQFRNEIVSFSNQKEKQKKKNKTIQQSIFILQLPHLIMDVNSLNINLVLLHNSICFKILLQAAA